MLPNLNPIKIKDRVSWIFIEKGNIDVIDGSFVVIDQTGIRTHIPIGTIACLMLEPGTRLSHAAARLAAQTGTLIIWIGEAGVRLYSCGQPGGYKSDRILHQAALFINENTRLKIARKMYKMRFKEEAPEKRSIAQLRGIEGIRVKQIYQNLAKKFNVVWKCRNYNTQEWNKGDLPNRCLSSATACLYGITEAAILACGYSPSIGFIHTGKSLSFVYDIADIIKFDRIIPFAFEAASKNPHDPERFIRLGCRNIFREEKTLDKIIPLIDEVLNLEEYQKFSLPEPIQPIAIEIKKGIGDAGHCH